MGAVILGEKSAGVLRRRSLSNDAYGELRRLTMRGRWQLSVRTQDSLELSLTTSVNHRRLRLGRCGGESPGSGLLSL